MHWSIFSCYIVSRSQRRWQHYLDSTSASSHGSFFRCC